VNCGLFCLHKIAVATRCSGPATDGRLRAGTRNVGDIFLQAEDA
jgi:hypothetical protein